MKYGYEPPQTMTSEELERLAYIKGDTIAANLYASQGALDDINAQLPSGEEDHDAAVLIEQIQDLGGIAEIQSKLRELELYREFFNDCFQRLSGHYPCPSVSSDYDKSVIFAAIEKGEGVD